ncbi:glycosyltransferase family 4 protein [Kitasatospora sp. MAP5-34]|uniref:glycosyltransferase family 4 protein n=1 Tax=Kitasatospora sp. MAP5-34 TaxID=3035102 RepID=UPI0024736D07|nr:glycosyltransferase family 4 protein [Kitasatospora sp. MAP5-34]MDH6578061.1 D-inositol-3-phosphate glycosyltransferase [Kitasatospora sp. MAP5-34]
MSEAERPLRVLLVSHYYPPHVGGIENVVRQEAVHLTARGVEVTVLTSGESGSVRDEEGVRVVRIAAWNGVERAGVPFPVPGPQLLTAALRWARRADVVHLHDCLYLTSWAAGLAALLTRTPQFVTQHVAMVEHPSGLVRAVQRIVYGVAGRALLRRARRVFTLNASVTGFVRGLGARPARLGHLPNGVDTALFRPAASAEERDLARERFGLPPDRPLVLFVGRLVPKKGYDLLLAAHDADAFDLVFAGDGDVEALAGRPGVHALGPLPPEALAEVYRACDVFALPSTAEGFPLSVQEAMASGLPVLTTDDPGYAPYELDRSLVALTARDAGVLRGTLAGLVGDAGRLAEMRRYSLAYATTRFSWPDHADTLVRHYRDPV